MRRSRKFDLPRAMDYLSRMDAFLKGLEARKRRRKGKDEGGELVPVEPAGPKSLSGGAAVALEFDE